MSGKYVIGNWKMNPATIAEAQALAATLQSINVDTVKIGCTPSFVHIATAQEQLKDTPIWVGAQDVCALTDKVGAFTGDVSAWQLVDMGVRFVLIGHSERRTYHQECHKLLANKVSQSAKVGLVVVFCIGETQEEYQAKTTLMVLDEQLTALQGAGIPSSHLVVAYEPVWAIGTGLTPTLAEVEMVHRHIKQNLTAQGLSDVCVLYGGSINNNNAHEFAQSAWVDGVLVGGASLKIDSFAAIIEAFA